MATLPQTINLFLQIAIFLILGIGSFYAFKKRRFAQHAQMMAVAWGINLASFLLIMVPSLISTAPSLLASPLAVFSLASIAHIPFGLAALILSTFLVLRWAANSNRVSSCMGKWPMRAAVLIWEASTMMGVVIYFTMTS